MKGSVFTLTIKPSRLAAAILFGVHILACAAIAMAELPAVLRVSLIVVVVANAVWPSIWKREDLTLRCQADGRLTVQDGGEPLSAELVPGSIVWPSLIVLRYRLSNERRTSTCIVLADGLAEDDFRRLRVWLRWVPLPVEGRWRPEEN